MEIWLTILIGLSAVIHIGFLIMQMFLWNTDFVQKKVIGDFEPKEIAAILAKNQGLYNGFLAAGLLWGLYKVQTTPVINPSEILIFFLICMAIAGIFGSLSLKRPTAFLLQTLPAVVALVLLGLLKI